MKREVSKDLFRRKRATLLMLTALVSILLCLLSAQAQSDSQPTRFEFYFRGAAPGMRVWTRDRETWTETYSSGQRGTFRVKTFPYRFHGMTGALIQKVDEKDFYLFIPNLRSAKMEVWTYKAQGPWRFLAKMTDIGPVNID